MTTRTRTARIGGIAVLAAAAMALSACASTGGSSAGSDVKSQVVVAIPGDIDNFDPDTNQLITYQYAVKALVFSSLVKYDQNLKVVPDLATFTVNSDATKFTFKLTSGALFQDGTKVDAKAVVASLKRAAGTKGSIWAPRLAGVSDYATPDASTVEITLSTPNAAFLAGLVDISILAPSSYDDTAKKPVGSGPYKFVSWQPNKQITLTRFDDYFGGKAPTKTIVEKPITDQQVALNDLYSGSIDVIANASTATTKQVDASRAKVVTPSTTNSMDLIEYNSSGKLADPRVRQALAMAFDKKSIQKIAYSGAGSTTWSPLPASSWAYEKQDGYTYDLDKAKALLAEAGASNLSFTLYILSGYPQAEQMARVWQQDLAKVGVTLTPKVSELSVWLDAYVSRDYDAIWNSFNVGGDPNSFFDVIMTPHVNDDYPNAQVKSLMADAIATSDQDARAKIYAKLQKTIVDQLPVMVIEWAPVSSITSPKVTGYRMNPLGWALLDKVAASK